MVSPLNSSSELNFSKKRTYKTKQEKWEIVILIQNKNFFNYKYIWPKHPTFLLSTRPTCWAGCLLYGIHWNNSPHVLIWLFF